MGLILWSFLIPLTYPCCGLFICIVIFHHEFMLLASFCWFLWDLVWGCVSSEKICVSYLPRCLSPRLCPCPMGHRSLKHRLLAIKTQSGHRENILFCTCIYSCGFVDLCSFWFLMGFLYSFVCLGIPKTIFIFKTLPQTLSSFHTVKSTKNKFKLF